VRAVPLLYGGLLVAGLVNLGCQALGVPPPHDSWWHHGLIDLIWAWALWMVWSRLRELS
jgi:hypothetical protein